MSQINLTLVALNLTPVSIKTLKGFKGSFNYLFITQLFVESWQTIRFLLRIHIRTNLMRHISLIHIRFIFHKIVHHLSRHDIKQEKKGLLLGPDINYETKIAQKNTQQHREQVATTGNVKRTFFFLPTRELLWNAIRCRDWYQEIAFCADADSQWTKAIGGAQLAKRNSMESCDENFNEFRDLPMRSCWRSGIVDENSSMCKKHRGSF